MVTEERTARTARLAVQKIKLLLAGRRLDWAPRVQPVVRESQASKTVNRVQKSCWLKSVLHIACLQDKTRR